MSESPFTIRQAEPGDVSFLFSSWLKSYRDSPSVKGVPSSIYYPAQHEVIEKILQRPCCTCLVACDVQDPTQIFGYLVGEFSGDGIIIHFVYSKYNLRNLGIAKALISTIVIPSIKWVQFSHKTRAIETLGDKIKEFTYNPYVR